MMASELEELGDPLAGADAGAQLHQVIDIARKQRNAVDGFRGDELADGGVAGVNDVRRLPKR